MELVGVILAGGLATRLSGLAKGLLPGLAGESIVLHQARELLAAGVGEVVLICNDPEPYRETHLEILPDIRLGNGPMGGIEAGLVWAAGRARGAVFLPCDMPAISRVEINKLIVAWRHSQAGLSWALLCGDHEPCSQNTCSQGIQRHPLCCVVSAGHSRAVSKSIDEGKLKIRQLWEDLQATEVRFANAPAFENINTPEDLQAWRLEQQQ